MIAAPAAEEQQRFSDGDSVSALGGALLQEAAQRGPGRCRGR